MSHEAHNQQSESPLTSAVGGGLESVATEQAQHWADLPVLTVQVSAADGSPGQPAIKEKPLLPEPARWLLRVKEASGRASRWSVLLLLGTATVVAATAMSVASVSPWSKPVVPAVQQVIVAKHAQPPAVAGSTSSLPTAASQAPEPAPASVPLIQAPASTPPISVTVPGLFPGQRSVTQDSTRAVAKKPVDSDQSKPVDALAGSAPAASAPSPVASRVAVTKESTHPQDACAARSSFQRKACLSEQCARSAMSQHPFCQGLRKQREQEAFQELYGSP